MNHFKFFSHFWSKNKTDYYIKKFHIETLNEIQDILEDKMKYSTRGIVDLSFDKNMITKKFFFQYIKHGVLDFLPSTYIKLLTRVLDDQMYDGYQNEVQELYDFISKLKSEYELEVKDLRKKIKIYKFIG